MQLDRSVRPPFEYRHKWHLLAIGIFTQVVLFEGVIGSGE